MGCVPTAPLGVPAADEVGHCSAAAAPLPVSALDACRGSASLSSQELKLPWLLAHTTRGATPHNSPRPAGPAADPEGGRPSLPVSVVPEVVGTDPRWDTEGFNKACEESQMLWVRVAWIRGLAAQGGVMPRRQDLPEEAVGCVGAPPPRVALYWASYCWQTKERADPHGFVLGRLSLALQEDSAEDEDLVWLNFVSIFQQPRTDEEQELFTMQVRAVSTTMLHHRVRFVCLPDVGEGVTPYFEKGWTIYEFATAAYTSRIINSGLPDVAKHMRPEFIMDFDNVIEKACFTHGTADVCLVKHKRRQLAESMPPAKEDSAGFLAACEEAQFRWVRVGFLRRWRDRRGPPPRHQDLPRRAYVDGAVPVGRQAFVVSYPWAAHLHPFPDGGKVRELVVVLDELKAKNTDLVFLDFMSLPQEGRILPRAYKELNPQATMDPVPSSTKSDRSVPRNEFACVVSLQVSALLVEIGRVVLPGRTSELDTQFRLALFETTRLYAYQECKVIVLPSCADPPESFSKPEEIEERENTYCDPPRLEKHTPYGYCKSIPYESGGWTCVEYAVARKNGRIANAHHEDVQRVEAARKWPDTVHEFADMMDEKSPWPVCFTKKGDREGVRFNFYKYCYRLSDTDMQAV